MSNNSGESGKVSWRPLLAIFLGVVLFWTLTVIVLPVYFPTIETRGQFGDSFGAINALFAGLAFAGVIWAIMLQQKELALQRKELKETREEIRGQKEQLQAQNQTLQKQNFETSFFQLLGIHNDIVNSMAIRGKSDGECLGRDCFDHMLKKIKNAFLSEDVAGATIGWNGPEIKKLFNDTYENKFFAEYQPYIGNYFRHLYNVVKFVDESDFPKGIKNKKAYTNFIRAQLSSNELGVLFYNCRSERGAKFKVLVERYALFEDMPSDVSSQPTHRDAYDKSAYGESG